MKQETNFITKGIITALLLAITSIFLINLVSATTIYAGECLEVDLSELESLDNVVYDVVGNSSNLEGLTIELNGTIANVCTVPNYKPDSFTIIFIDDSTETIVSEVYVGGGSHTVYKDKFIEVDNYLDRIVYKDREIIKLEDEEETIDILQYVGWGVALVLSLIFTIIIIKKMLNKNKEINT